jgi:oligogalacturonide transporter
MVKPTERRVSYGVAIGYGITDLFGGGAFAIIGTWLLFFYTTYCGLSVLEAGSIFAIARVIDAVLSPIMGYITDNFGNTWLGRRFGRRRFFLLLSSPLMFLYALLWLTDMGYWYYLGTYLSIELLSAMVLVPWETLAAEMTNRYEERSRLSGVRMICSQLGGFLAVSVPGILMQFTGKDNPFTYTLTGLIFSVVFCLAVFITWRCTWEAKDVQEETFQTDLQRNSGLLNHLKYLILDLFSSFRIRAFRLHIIIYIFSFTAMDVFGSVFTYYVVYCLSQDAASVSGWLSIAAFASVFGTYGFMLLLNKLNITPSAALRLSYTCIFSVLLFLFIIYYTETRYPTFCSRRYLFYSVWRVPAFTISHGISTALFLISTKWLPNSAVKGFCRRYGTHPQKYRGNRYFAYRHGAGRVWLYKRQRRAAGKRAPRYYRIDDLCHRGAAGGEFLRDLQIQTHPRNPQSSA